MVIKIRFSLSKERKIKLIRDISVTGGHEPLLMMLTNHHLICREYNDSVSLKGYNKLLKVNDTLFYALPEFGLVKYVVIRTESENGEDSFMTYVSSESIFCQRGHLIFRL